MTGSNRLYLEDDVYIRTPCKQLAIDELRKEFFSVLREYTERTFNRDDWETVLDDTGQPLTEYNDDDSSQCICSHYIKHLFFAKHIPTGRIFQIGSKCFEHIDERLYRQVKARRKEVCYNPPCRRLITDRRKVYMRDGFCCERCYTDVRKHGRTCITCAHDCLFKRDVCQCEQCDQETNTTIAEDDDCVEHNRCTDCGRYIEYYQSYKTRCLRCWKVWKGMN